MKKTLVILFALFSAAGAYAQKPAIVTDKSAGWQKIGETKVNFETERDEIAVMGADKFKSLKLKVTDAAVNISDVEVYFENGEKETLNVRSEIKPGMETRAFDLKGYDRAIKKVVYIYKTAPNSANDKAHVELWGLK
jgi:hypothetical protein